MRSAAQLMAVDRRPKSPQAAAARAARAMPLAGLTVGFINQQLSVQPAVGSLQPSGDRWPVLWCPLSIVHCPLFTLNQTRCPFMRLSLGRDYGPCAAFEQCQFQSKRKAEWVWGRCTLHPAAAASCWPATSSRFCLCLFALACLENCHSALCCLSLSECRFMQMPAIIVPQKLHNHAAPSKRYSLSHLPQCEWGVQCGRG